MAINSGHQSTYPDPGILIGRWRLERVILDRRNRERLTADGEADLAWSGDDKIRWSERGILHHGESELCFRRVYLIRRRGESWQVTFEDGRDFHPWTPGETARHPCGPDLYQGVIDLGDSATGISSWRVTWRVRGPQKDLELKTCFSNLKVPL